MDQIDKINNLIEKLNNLIQEEVSCIKSSQSQYTTFIILGTPRSGTTLISQIIGSSNKVVYPSNLVSRFWKNPVYGFALQVHLGLNSDSNFISNYGRTQGITEPHEFSYFWRNSMTIPNFVVPLKKINTKQVIETEKKLNACKNILQKNLILKNFFLAGNLKTFKENSPSSTFIILKRKEIDTCISMYKGQKEYLNDKEEWMGIHPDSESLLRYDKMVRVIIQYRYINSLLKSDMKKLQKEDFIFLEYEKLIFDGVNYLNNLFKNKIHLNLQPHLNEYLNKPTPHNSKLRDKYFWAQEKANEYCEANDIIF